MTFTLADSAFAFACNSYNRVTVAASGEIRFAGLPAWETCSSPRQPSAAGASATGYVTVTVGEVVAEFRGQ
jgi:acyl-CoA thioesterase